MYRIIPILTYIIVGIIAATSAMAEQDTLKRYNMGEVVVTAEHGAIVQSASILEIDKSLMDAMNAYSIDEALKFEPGMYIRRNSRGEGVINIRGFDQRQIAVFLDGAPIYLPYDGLLDLSMLPSISFEKISVSKSMPSILYGANSMGGTINFISDEITSGSRININMFGGNYLYGSRVKYLGSYGDLYWNISASADKSQDFNLAESFRGARHESGGKMGNSNREGIGAYAKLGYALSDRINLALSAFHVDNEKSVPVNIYTTKPRYWVYPEWKKTALILNHQEVLSDLFSVKGNFFYENFRNVLDSYDDSTMTSQTQKYAFHSTYDDYTFGGALTPLINTTILPPTKLSLLFKKDVHREWDNKNSPLEKYTANNYSFGIEQEYDMAENVGFVGALSYDLMIPAYANGDTIRPSTSLFNWHLGGIWKINENIGIHAHASAKSRFPTLKELYSDLLSTNLSNPELESENTLNTELGLRYGIADNLETHVNFFRSDVRNLIQLFTLEENKRQFQNIGKALFQGVEAVFIYKNPIVDVELNYTYQSNENITPGALSKNLEYRPRHIINCILSSSYNFGFGWRIESSYYGVQYGVDSDSNTWERLRDYFLMNIKLKQRLVNNYSIFFRVNNLLDRYYETEYGYPQPGINYLAGLECEF